MQRPSRQRPHVAPSQSLALTAALLASSLLTLAACSDDSPASAVTSGTGASSDSGGQGGAAGDVGPGGDAGAGLGGAGANGGSGGDGGLGGGSGGPPAGISSIWARRFGASMPGYRSGTHVAVDADQNVYMAGYFDDDSGNESPNTIHFGGAASFTSNGQDAFVVKLDQLGAPLWAHHLDASGDVDVRSVAVDSTGALIAVGRFVGTFDLGGTIHSSFGGGNFIVKYDTDGTISWSKSYGGGSAGTAIAVDASDNLLFGGNTDGGIAFDGHVVTDELFIAKLTPVGAAVWAQGFDVGGVTGWVLHDLAVDPAGDVAFVGIEAFGTTSVDISVGKLAAVDGALQWRQGFAGPGWDTGFGIDTDAAGNLFVAGTFEDSLTVGTSTVVADDGEDELVVFSLDPAGQVRWSRAAGPVDSSCCAGPRLAVDLGGHVVISGGASAGTLDFGGGPLTSVADEIFMAKLDNDGQHVFSRRFTGGYSWSADIAVDPLGNSYITGSIRDTIDFGSGLLNVSGNNGDAVVVKFPPM
jgi:hypothetical protein